MGGRERGKEEGGIRWERWRRRRESETEREGERE